MSKSKLKPCPFCGAKPDVAVGDSLTSLYIQSDGIIIGVIHCSGCSAKIEAAADNTILPSNGLITAHSRDGGWKFFEGEIDRVKDAAVREWNRRAKGDEE